MKYKAFVSKRYIYLPYLIIGMGLGLQSCYPGFEPNQINTSVNSSQAQNRLPNPPTISQIDRTGIGIGAPQDWLGDKLFADMMKTSRKWDSPTSSLPVRLDSNGWPLEDAKTTIFHNLPGDNSGVYGLSFTGKATVSIKGGTLNNIHHDRATNKSTATITVENPTYLSLMLKNIIGVSNVKLMRPVAPGASRYYKESELFTHQIKHILSKFSVVRFMDYLATNSNKQAQWSDRVLPIHATQNQKEEGYGWAGKGGSYEHAIQLANEVGFNPWLNIPIRANDDYILKLAQLIAFGSDGENPYTSVQKHPKFPPLNLNLRVYLEYSNEVWNTAGAFQQTSANDELAKQDIQRGVKPLLNHDGATNHLGRRRLARRTVKISNIFRAVFGDAHMMTRIRPVIASHARSPISLYESLQFIEDSYDRPVNYYIYGGGGAAYYNPDNKSSTLTIENIWDSFDVDKWIEKDMKPNMDLTAAYGIKRISYEGGPSMDDGGSDDVKVAAWSDPRMTDIVLEHQSIFDNMGADLLVYFTLTGDHRWGFMEEIYKEGTPKMQAINQIVSQPKLPITYGTPIPTTLLGNSFSIASPIWLTPGSGSKSLTEGQWVSYTLRLDTEASYFFKMNFSKGSGTVALVIDGVTQDSFTLSGSGTSPGISLSLMPGIHSFRVNMISGSIEIDQIHISKP